MPQKKVKIGICQNPKCGKDVIAEPRRLDLEKDRGLYCGKSCANVMNRIKEKIQDLRFNEDGELVEQKCTKCKVWLPIEYFGILNRSVTGKNPRCKKCEQRRKLMEKYKISSEMADLYTNKLIHCMICGTTEDICVDHCHETLINRGALCNRHNTAFGFLNEDPEEIEKLLIYARFWKKYKENREVA